MNGIDKYRLLGFIIAVFGSLTSVIVLLKIVI